MLDVLHLFDGYIHHLGVWIACSRRSQGEALQLRLLVYNPMNTIITSLVGGLEHFFIFPYVGDKHPNRLIFFRGVETTNRILIWLYKHNKPFKPHRIIKQKNCQVMCFNVAISSMGAAPCEIYSMNWTFRGCYILILHGLQYHVLSISTILFHINIV